MAAIKQQALAGGGGLNQQQRENLQKLQKHRQCMIEDHRMSAAPELKQHANADDPPKGRDSQGLSGGAAVVKRHSSKSKRSAPPPPVTMPNDVSPSTSHPPPGSASSKSPLGATFTVSPGLKHGSPLRKAMDMTLKGSLHGSPLHSPKTAVNITKVRPELGTELVELVRSNTQLSYDKSQVAVGTVLTHLKENIPEIGLTMDQIMDVFSDKRENIPVDGGRDAERLEAIFEELAVVKGDSQQRSWFLHEDESSICNHLEELISILENANPDICKLVLAHDQYAAIDNMVLYYQMETRISIRLLLLQAFGALCGLHPQIIHELLNSVLPLELARDMQATSQDFQRLYYSATVLTMIFCMGEPMPVQHYEHLNEDFLVYLLENIDSPPECDVNEDIPDFYAKVILSYNLHFELPTDNLVMKTLAGQGTAKTFTEKLLLLVNRGDDPVRMFEHEPQPPNSLLKLLSDVYSSPTTASLLYTNDAMVLIDIVLRHLSDLSPGDKMRTENLSLFHLIVENSDYGDHQHRKQELDTCFNGIAQEEGPESKMDIHIIKEIWKDFPQYFQQTIFM